MMASPARASHAAPSPSVSRPSVLRRSISKILRTAYGHIDLLVTVALLAASVALAILGRHIPIFIPAVNFLDDSWRLDMVFKATHHVWFGHDVVFTYGPLYQAFLSSLPAVLGFSAGAVYKTWPVILFCISTSAVYFTSVLLLRGQPPWKRAFYLLAVALPWSPGDSKAAVVVFVFAVLTVLFLGQLNSPSSMLWRPLMTSSVVLLSFLFSADTGMYSVAILVILTLAAACCSIRDSIALTKIFKFGLLNAVFIAVGILVVNAMIARPFDFRFWKGSIEIVTKYRWQVPIAMRPKRLLWQLVVTGFSSLVFLRAWIRRDPNSPSLARRPGFLLAAFAFSLLCLQTTVVRSDPLHLAMGLLPIVSLAIAILVSASATKESANLFGYHRPLYFALGLVALFGGPLPLFATPFVSPVQVLRRLAFEHSPGSKCPAATSYLDQMCLTDVDFRKLSPVSSRIQNLVSSSDPIAVFPFEHIYGVVARRLVAGGVEQNYPVGGNYLIQRYLQGLIRGSPQVAIYTADGLPPSNPDIGPLDGPIDGISNFTRTPELWFYLQQHYREEAEPVSGTLLLRRDESRQAKWKSEEEEIASPTTVYPVKRGSAINLGNLTRWPQGADFLKLNLTVSYPPQWKILKPSQLIVDIEFADGTHKLAPAALEPNEVTEVWIHPGDEFQLRRYFSANSTDWRAAASSVPISHLALRVEPFDWFSVIPTRISIHKVEAVRISLNRKPGNADQPTK